MKKVYAINACVLVIIFLTAGIIARPSDYNREMKKFNFAENGGSQ